jgi:hypothetical protein
LRKSQSLTGNNNFVLVHERQDGSVTLLNLESVAKAELVLAGLTDGFEHFFNSVSHFSLVGLHGFTLGSEVSLLKKRLKVSLNSYHHIGHGYQVCFGGAPLLEGVAYLEVGVHLNQVVDKALLHLVALVRVADLLVDESEAFVAVQLFTEKFKLLHVRREIFESTYNFA